MFNLFKKNKIELYVVVDSKNTKAVYTVLSNVKEVEEYIYTLILRCHYEHFISWCKVHKGKEADNKETQREYVYSVHADELKKYGYLKVVYDSNTVASMFRIANGCVPIGCSYETSVEQKLYFDSIDLFTDTKVDSTEKKSE